MPPYEAFAQVQADWIATAHTASDNLDTLVHRMVRGASLHGLTAIPPQKRQISPSAAAHHTGTGGDTPGGAGTDLCDRQHQSD